MKWFKHMTDASRDEALMAVRDEFGHVGYAVYWMVLEAIAEHMTPENDTPELTLSAKNWRKITEISPKKFQKFVTFSSKNKLFSSKTEGVMITIKCDKLLKIRDEYNRKASGGVRTKSGETPDPFTSSSPSQGKTKYTGTNLSEDWKRNGDEWLNTKTGETRQVTPFDEVG